MKLWSVDFPLRIVLGVIVLFITCEPCLGQKKIEKRITIEKKIDSISLLYSLSNEDSLSISKRLVYISSFLDGALNYNQDALVFKGLLQKTWLLGRVKQYDSAIYYTTKLYDLAKQKNDTSHIAKALKKLGIYHRKNYQFDKAFESYNENFKISKAIKDTINAGRRLLNMAYLQTFLGDFSGSKTTAIDGVKYLENSSDISSLSSLYHRISVANREQKNYDEALKYNTLAMFPRGDSLANSEIDIKNLLVFKNTKANILADQKKYKQALSILAELEKGGIVRKNNKEYARVIDNLGYVKWLKDSGNKDSEKLLLKARDLRAENNDFEGLIASNIHLAKYYLTKDKEKALRYAEDAYNKAKEQRSLTSILEALGYIFDLKEETNEEAKVFNEVYHELTVVNQSNREIYAVTKYDNDKLTNQNLLLKAEKEKQQRQKIIYLLGSIILILISGFVFYLLQQQFRREKIREVYKAETRISKRIHDELANDVYNLMVQVQNNKGDHKLLDKIEDIYLRTRDISRESNSLEMSGNYEQELSAMLSSYSSDNTMIFVKGINDVNWQSIIEEKKIIVHRVLQELMVNMKKHSSAGLVVVTFNKTPGNVNITYSDNGIGVSVETINYSNGLANVENRIKTIGGIFIFDSEIGKGFKTKISFPT